MTKKELENLQRLAKDCEEAQHVPRWVSFRLEKILEGVKPQTGLSFPVEIEECDEGCDNCMYKGTQCDQILMPFDNPFTGSKE